MAQDDDTDNESRFRLTTDALTGLSKGFSELAGTFLTGTPTIAGTIESLQGFGGVLGTVSKAFGSLAGFAEGQTELYQTLSRRGVTFGGRLDEMSLSAIEARLNLEQLSKLVEENSEVIAGFGQTADSGMRQFLRRSSQFMETEYATQLRRLGFTFEDINATLVDYERMIAITGYTNRMSDQQRNAAAAEFAMELDVLSKLTGKQTEQIAEEMRERQREGDYRAFLMGLSPDQVQSVMAAQVQAEAAGVGDLFKDMMVRGVPSTEETRLQAAMLGESFDVMSQMRQQMLSGDTAGFDRNAAGLTGVALNEMASEGYRSVAMLGGLTSAGSAAASALGDVSEANFRYLDEIRSGRLTPEQAAELSRQARAEAESEQRDLTEDAAPGDTRIILQSVLGLQDQLLATAEEVQRAATTRLYQELANAVSPFVDTINSFNPEAFVDGISSGMGDLTGGIKDSLDLTEAERVAQENFNAGTDRESAQRLQQIVEQLRVETDPTRILQLETEKESLMAQLQNLEITAGTVNLETNSLTGIDGNATGTVGTYGNILQDFGTESLSFLHGREAVLTEAQLTNLTRNLVNFGESQAFRNLNIRNMTPMLQGMLNNIRPQMQSIASQMAPQMELMAEQMMPMIEQMASQMQGPMREMAEQLRGPMENMAGTMQRQLGVSTKSLRAVQGAGNLFRGLNV